MNKTDSICKDLEAYTRECLSQGLCMDWRLKTNCFMKCTEGRIISFQYILNIFQNAKFTVIPDFVSIICHYSTHI